MVRALIVGLLLSVAAGSAFAQATSPVNGTLAAGEERFHSFTIDFGSTPTSHVITLSVTSSSGTAGIEAFVGDLDELAANGFVTGGNNGSDPGTTTVNVTLTTPVYTGVHTFIVNISEYSVSGGMTYTGTISSGTLGTTAITAGTTVLRAPQAARPSVEILFGRVVLIESSLSSSGGAFDVLVNFGGTAQAITFWSQADADDTGTMQPQEILASGAASNLGAAVSWTGSGGGEANRTTSSRSGNVRLRLQYTSASGMDVNSALVVPSTVSLVALTQLTASGSLTADQRRVHRFSVDFGASATTLSLMLISDVSTGSTNTVALDRTEVAANGQATGYIPGVPFTTAAHSGVHDILIVIEEDGGSTATYNLVIAIAVSSAAVTTATPQVGLRTDPLTVLYDFAVICNSSAATGVPSAVEFLVDFGASPQAVTFHLQGEGGASGDISISEITTGGTPSALGTNLTGSGSWNDDANYITSSRSGLVRFRVAGIPTSGNMDFTFSAIFPDTVAVQPLTLITVTGTLAANQQRAHRFGINFGGASTAYGVTLVSAITTGSLDFLVVDVNDTAVNGTGAFISDPSFVTAAHTGAQDFLIVLGESTGTGVATYTVTMAIALPTASVTSLGTQVFTASDSLMALFNVAAQGTDAHLAGGGTITREFNADFGGTTHTASLWLQGDGDDTASVELFDISGAVPLSLGTVSWTGSNSDEINITTPARTGVIRLRIVVTTTVVNSTHWVVMIDRSVNVFLDGSGGGGDDGDDGGCSTGQGSSNWLALLAGLGLLVVALRLRRA